MDKININTVMDSFYGDVLELKKILLACDDIIDDIVSLRGITTMDEVRHKAHSIIITLKKTYSTRGLLNLQVVEIVKMIEEIIIVEAELRALNKLNEVPPSTNTTLH